MKKTMQALRNSYLPAFIFLLFAQTAIGQSVPGFTDVKLKIHDSYGRVVSGTFSIPADTLSTAPCGRSIALVGNKFLFRNSSCVWAQISGTGGSGGDADSLNGQPASYYIDITDTSGMLLPYLRKGDTASMLAPYLKEVDTVHLSNRINAKYGPSDTSTLLATQSDLEALGTFSYVKGTNIDSLVQVLAGNNIRIKGISFVFGTTNSVTRTDSTVVVNIDTTGSGTSGDPSVGGDLSGTASNAQIVANAVGTTEIGGDAVTNAKLANVGANTIKGSNNGATGDPEDLTPTEVTAMLNDATSSLKGLYPVADYLNDKTTFARTNPTGTVTHTYGAHGAHEVWAVNTSITPTLAYSGMTGSAVVLYTVFNTSGSTQTVTLPSNSFINGASAATLTLPTGTSGFALTLISGGNYYFKQDGTAAAGVTSFNSRTGAVTPQAGDYNSITETLSNKDINTSNGNVLKLRGITMTASADGTGTYTFPSTGSNLTIVTTASGQTLSSKTIDGTTNTLQNIPQSAVTNLVSDLSGKQSTLVSGTNIKTVNGNSLLGSGDISISAGAQYYQTFQDDGTPMPQQDAANFKYPFSLADDDGRTNVNFIEREYDVMSTWSQANLAPFYSTSSGTGSGAALMTTGNTIAGYTGGLILSTGTTVGGFGATYVGSAVGTRIPFSLDSNFRFNWTTEFSVPTLSNSTDRYEIYSGMGEYVVPSSSITDGVYVRYRDDDSSGQIILVAENNNTKSERATGVTLAANTTYTVEFSVYKGQVECYIKPSTGNRVKSPTITSNVPTGAARQSNLLTVIYKVAGTTNVDMYLKSTGFGTQTY